MTDKIKELAEIMKANDLTEIEYENENEKLCLKRGCKPEHPSVSPMSPSFEHPGMQSSVGNIISESGRVVKAPLVGTFYAAPGVDKEPYVKVGDHVKKGQVIGIVEAMKLMNEIESDADGVVAEILAENGKMVEFGQGLIRLN